MDLHSHLVMMTDECSDELQLRDHVPRVPLVSKVKNEMQSQKRAMTEKRQRWQRMARLNEILLEKTPARVHSIRGQWQ